MKKNATVASATAPSLVTDQRQTERAEKAIEIRRATAKATKGRPLTFPTRLAKD